MIRLVTQFDDERTRPTVATPSCGCCCCCCCCVTTTISTIAISGLQLTSGPAAKQERSAVVWTGLVINMVVAWVAASYLINAIDGETDANGWSVLWFLSIWAGFFAGGLFLIATYAGKQGKPAMKFATAWTGKTMGFFFLEFIVGIGVFILSLVTFGVGALAYLAAAVYISIRLIRRWQRVHS